MSGERVSFRLEILGEYLFNQTVLERVERDDRTSPTGREKRDCVPERCFYGSEFIIDRYPYRLEAPYDGFWVIARVFYKFCQLFCCLDRFRFPCFDYRFRNESCFGFLSVVPEDFYELFFTCEIYNIVRGFLLALAVEPHVELTREPKGESSIRIIEVSAGYSQIVAYSRDTVNAQFGKLRLDIAKIRMDAMNGNVVFSGKCAAGLFDVFSSTGQVVAIEVETYENVSFVEIPDDLGCMASESERAINHDIPLRSA